MGLGSEPIHAGGNPEIPALLFITGPSRSGKTTYGKALSHKVQGARLFTNTHPAGSSMSTNCRFVFMRRRDR